MGVRVDPHPGGRGLDDHSGGAELTSQQQLRERAANQWPMMSGAVECLDHVGEVVDGDGDGDVRDHVGCSGYASSVTWKRGYVNASLRTLRAS